MKLLVHSRFFPSIGGIETVTWLLAHEWHRLGHEVTVVSDVTCPPDKQAKVPFGLVYRPSPRQWIRLMSATELFVQMNISLKVSWPLFLVRKPWVAVHHGLYVSDGNRGRGWRARLKLRAARSARRNIAVSRAVARAVPVPCEIIGNPFCDSTFRCGETWQRRSGLAFVGRLVSEKGLDLLLAALAKLKDHSITPRLVVVGDGPERPALEQQMRSLALDSQVTFAGAKAPAEVAAILREREILVVPSLYEEAFGVVALEGAACGCVVLSSDGGGLPEAVGPAGLTFRRGMVSDLVEKLLYLLRAPDPPQHLLARVAAHLAEHRPSVVATRYLEVFNAAITNHD